MPGNEKTVLVNVCVNASMNMKILAWFLIIYKHYHIDDNVFTYNMLYPKGSSFFHSFEQPKLYKNIIHELGD